MQQKNIKRGDVVLLVFPNSDLSTAKIRPAAIVQANNLQTGLPQVIVAMITSRVIRSMHPSRILVSLNTVSGKQSGLLTDSVVMTDNLTTVNISAIYSTIGFLPTLEIDRALKHTLGI
ncbi:type II toxin-antitoxin system PemK/MazF family toxin [Pseudanabaena sp. 'Roaring Creek']|uniref:type II toxin-antitoxin system PemK/MazF family toxin n=1 Tax=Pseudanabaena sp. 'Roaring Creek' TaxID=1681830 RepID=UPI0006D82D2F|nr:type II toxin-antitoxin system PemK/MazF family toxin [Pseudanabaena sp. 'Roaring Creek']